MKFLFVFLISWLFGSLVWWIGGGIFERSIGNGFYLLMSVIISLVIALADKDINRDGK